MTTKKLIDLDVFELEKIAQNIATDKTKAFIAACLIEIRSAEEDKLYPSGTEMGVVKGKHQIISKWIHNHSEYKSSEFHGGWGSWISQQYDGDDINDAGRISSEAKFNSSSHFLNVLSKWQYNEISVNLFGLPHDADLNEKNYFIPSKYWHNIVSLNRQGMILQETICRVYNRAWFNWHKEASMIENETNSVSEQSHDETSKEVPSDTSCEAFIRPMKLFGPGAPPTAMRKIEHAMKRKWGTYKPPQTLSRPSKYSVNECLGDITSIVWGKFNEEVFPEISDKPALTRDACKRTSWSPPYSKKEKGVNMFKLADTLHSLSTSSLMGCSSCWTKAYQEERWKYFSSPYFDKRLEYYNITRDEYSDWASKKSSPWLTLPSPPPTLVKGIVESTVGGGGGGGGGGSLFTTE